MNQENVQISVVETLGAPLRLGLGKHVDARRECPDEVQLHAKGAVVFVESVGDL